jgi:hypothetical protein
MLLAVEDLGDDIGAPVCVIQVPALVHVEVEDAGAAVLGLDLALRLARPLCRRQGGRTSPAPIRECRPGAPGRPIRFKIWNQNDKIKHIIQISNQITKKINHIIQKSRTKFSLKQKT